MRAAGRRGDLADRLAALEGLDVPGLRAEWQRLYGVAPPPRLGRTLLTLAVAWQLQAAVKGGLAPATRRRLAALAGGAPPRRVDRLRPGDRLVRVWAGESHTVLVLDTGFEWRGRRWRSLSAIARSITGARWSGPRFFGLTGPAEAARPRDGEAGDG
ncbi:MAG: DUF2924 domain-containing protein [Marinovum algicola]